MCRLDDLHAPAGRGYLAPAGMAALLAVLGVSCDTPDIVDRATHCFLPARRRRGRSSSAGCSRASTWPCTAGSAERSSLLWFALHEVLGHRVVRDHDGGWVEYGSLRDAPVEL